MRRDTRPTPRQLELNFVTAGALTSILSLRERIDLEGGTRCPERVAKRLPRKLSGLELTSSSERPIHLRRRDHAFEFRARELLRQLGARKLAREVQIEWNPRLKSCAGRADYRKKLITLNPQLHHRPQEIDRTFRHELAHLLAQFRSGRRRILPHGKEWRAACADLGIGDEKRCHNLPFPYSERARQFLYQCPNCKRDFRRVRKIRRAIACLACCRKHNGGNFDARFRLKRVR